MCNKLSGGYTIVTIQTGKKRIYRVNYDNNNNNNFLFLQRKTNEHYQSSDISRDSGMSTLASQIEMFGKVGIIVSGLPVFIKLVDTLTGMI